MFWGNTSRTIETHRVHKVSRTLEIEFKRKAKELGPEREGLVYPAEDTGSCSLGHKESLQDLITAA